MPASSGNACKRLGDVTAKRSAASRAPRDMSGALTPKRRRKVAGVRTSIAPRDVTMAKPSPHEDGLAVGKDLEKSSVLLRLLGDDDNTGHCSNAVGMLLKGRVPEILRVVLLACRKVNVMCAAVFGESQRESDFHRRSVRPFCFAFEAQRVRLAYAGARERCRISVGILRFRE